MRENEMDISRMMLLVIHILQRFLLEARNTTGAMQFRAIQVQCIKM